MWHESASRAFAEVPRRNGAEPLTHAAATLRLIGAAFAVRALRRWVKQGGRALSISAARCAASRARPCPADAERSHRPVAPRRGQATGGAAIGVNVTFQYEDSFD